jgi:riboflavin kinase/FMN adenylyltransferase
MNSYLKSEIDSIAIGRFNGFHLGHRTLFHNLIGNGAILMIERDSKEYILPREYSFRYIELPIFKYKLMDVRELSGEDFVKKIVLDFPNLKRIVVGYDFRFAKNRDSSASDLVNILKIKFNLLNCEVFIVDEVLVEDISVHSAEILKQLRNGEIEIANKLLGRNYTIIGKEIRGQGLGKNALFPTINLDIGLFAKPMAGSYITETEINNKIYKSVTFIGVRSTDDNESIETHLIDTTLNINNFIDEIKIIFYKFIRGREHFNELDSLKKAINGDINIARNFF